MDYTEQKVGLPQKVLSQNVSLASKGLAVIFMLIHHLFSCNKSCYDEYEIFSFFLNIESINKISMVFKICVAIFVFISAYGMTVSISKLNDKKSIESSVSHRYKKLMLNFFVVYILCIATCFLQKNHLNVYMGEGRVKGILYMIMDATGLASFFGTPTYNETWWYMSFAILLIFAMPFLVKLYDMYGICSVVFSAMLPYCVDATTKFTKYMFVIFLGIWVYKEDVFKKIGDNIKHKKLTIIIDILVVYMFCWIRLKWGYTYWVDPLISCMIVFGMYILIDELHIKLSVLKLLGKHSMNIFFLHTIIFKYYFSDFIYSFKHWILISVVLIVVSLLLSIVIEQLKNI